MSTFQQTFQVTGMTCGHCVAAVKEEVGAIADVTDVTRRPGHRPRHGRQRPRGHPRRDGRRHRRGRLRARLLTRTPTTGNAPSTRPRNRDDRDHHPRTQPDPDR